jgi:diguanylate cyclase (GGDEF)-like protein
MINDAAIRTVSTRQPRSMIPGAPSRGASREVPGFDVQSLPVAVLVLVGGKVARANQHWLALTGLSEAQSLGDGWLAAVHVDDQSAVSSAALADGRPVTGQVRLRNVATSTAVWVQPRVRVTGPTDTPVVVVTLTEVGALKASEADLQFRASHDAMTGVLNKASFLDVLQESLERDVAAERPAAVFYIDLDSFKAVNDRNGHAVGDRLLIAAAERLRMMTRSSDVVSRMGGDEFAVLLLAPTEAHGRTAQRFAAALSAPYVFDGFSVQITASVGIAVFDGDRRASTIVDRADRAMYRAKSIAGASWADDAPPCAEPGDGDGTSSGGATAAGLATAASGGEDDRQPWDADSDPNELSGWDDEEQWAAEADWVDGGRRPWRVTVALGAVIAVVLAGWGVRALFERSPAARASDEPSVSTTMPTSTPASTDVGATPLDVASTAVSSVAAWERASVPTTSAPATTTSTATPTPTPTPPPVSTTGGRERGPVTAVVADAAHPAPTAPVASPGTVPISPAATTSGTSNPLLSQDPATTSAPLPDPPAPTTTQASAAPAGSVATAPTPTVGLAPTPPSAPGTTSTPAPTSVSTQKFVHVVASDEGPDQVAAWFAAIGQGRLYGHTKALHDVLPIGTTIIVSNETVEVDEP